MRIWRERREMPRNTANQSVCEFPESPMALRPDLTIGLPFRLLRMCPTEENW